VIVLGGNACTALVDLKILHDICILESKGIDTNNSSRSNAMLVTKVPLLKSKQLRNARASRSLITKSDLRIPDLQSRASHSYSLEQTCRSVIYLPLVLYP
jgi:hypothetical protein